MTTMRVLLVAFLVLLACPVIALAQGVGTLEGRVVNGTQGGAVPTGLEVTLLSDQGQMFIARADDQGRFRFDQLETDQGRSYVVRAAYKDVIYTGETLQFAPGQDRVSTELPVYEPTTDYGGITVERAHLFLNLAGASLSVTELHIFANPGDRTYIGAQQEQGRRWTSRFALPKGSRDLAFEDGSLGGRFLEIKDGFVDTEPLWPGRTSVIFSYVVDCKGGNCDLTRTLMHPVRNLNVLVPDVGMKVDSRQLAFAGNIDEQRARYLNYAGQNWAAGEMLDLRVRLAGGAPTASLGEAGQRSNAMSSLPWILLVTLLVALAVGYPYWRKRVQEVTLREHIASLSQEQGAPEREKVQRRSSRRS